MDNKRTRTPVRLVVCVDGTWFGPDGISSGWAGNISNIFRIWCCVREGEVQDSSGKTWHQERLYIKGVDNLNNWGSKLLSGAFGIGLPQQIKNVYKLCCDKAGQPEDEIFFFGFSRGAFVVRAVANLLAYMRIAKPLQDGQSFDELYAHMLDLYKDVRTGSTSRQGSIHEYMLHSQPHPRLQFIGVIDTVKAFDDGDLYDIDSHASLHHCRHALAMNETKSAFIPELWMSKEQTSDFELRKAGKSHSIKEAWFLGSHGDLGGGNAQDGIALYPCQWLLFEAQDCGLDLSFSFVTYTSLSIKNKIAVQNPLELCFPANEDPEGNSLAHMLLYSNGLQTMIWDMAAVHQRSGFDVRINQRPNHWIFSTTARNIFDSDGLIGYHETLPMGVFIHPSAYFVYDTSSKINSLAPAWPFIEKFHWFRQYALPDQKAVFWKQLGLEDDDLNGAKFRILVCGDAGVGKSTLINLLLGMPNLTKESETQHGQHNIEQGFSPEGAKYIVHDSCGFQTGQQDEIESVKTFLKSRLSSGDFAERLHAILYCIASTRVRTTESADREFFEALRSCDSTVPVIVVATRLDEFEALCSDRIETEYMAKQGKASKRQLTSTDWDEIDAETKATLDEKKQTLIDDIHSLQFSFSGPVFTSKRNNETIVAVVQTIANNLTDEKLRKMFIAAQICSVQPKIDYALANSISLYRRAVITAALPIAWSGLVASSTVTVFIVKDVLKTFRFESYSGDMASQIISTSLISNYQSNGIYAVGAAVNAAAVGAIGTGAGALVGAALGVAWWSWKLVVIPQFGRMLLMCTVDTILIMEMVFWQCGSRAPEVEDIKAACILYKKKVDQVHDDVKSVLGILDSVKAFQFEKLRFELSKIIDRYRSHKLDGSTSDESNVIFDAASSEVSTSMKIENISDRKEETKTTEKNADQPDGNAGTLSRRPQTPEFPSKEDGQ